MFQHFAPFMSPGQSAFASPAICWGPDGYLLLWAVVNDANVDIHIQVLFESLVLVLLA